MSSNLKNILLVRHAETEDNRNLAVLCEVLKQIKEFKIPKYNKICKCFKLLNFLWDVNSPLSSNGKRQVLDMYLRLKSEKIWVDLYAKTKSNILIVHSPLDRAYLTMKGIVPTKDDLNVNLEIKEMDLLLEATPLEHLPYFRNSMLKRIDEFELWLMKNTSDYDTIVVVGHSQYFKHMLHQHTHFQNCDVFQTNFNIDDRKWGDLNLLQRSFLSIRHPWDKGVLDIDDPHNINDFRRNNDMNNLKKYEELNNINHDSNDINDVNNEEPICRICHGLQSETPTKRLIRPCKCSGSQSYVHIECLNQWRSTSVSAHYSCLICKYDYNVKRTRIAKILMSETSIFYISLISITLFIIIFGILLNNLSLKYFDFKISDIIFQFTEYGRGWTIICGKFPRWKFSVSSKFDPRFDPMEYAIKSNKKISKWCFNTACSSPVLFLKSNEFFISSIETLITGICFFGLIGFVIYMSRQIKLVIDHGGVVNTSNLVLMGMYFLSLGNRVLCRLALTVGFVMAITEIYEYFLTSARTLAQAIGEQVLDYKF